MKRSYCPNHVGKRPEGTHLVGARYYCHACATLLTKEIP